MLKKPDLLTQARNETLMTMIVDIDGLTGNTEYIHQDEFEKLDLPAFITLSRPEEKTTSTDTESQITSA